MIIDIPSQKTDLKLLGVQPGWFLRYGGCTIWFEISEVWDNIVVAAARDPKLITETYQTGDFFSSIYQVTDEQPFGHWIKINREKNFIDKHFPYE